MKFRDMKIDDVIVIGPSKEGEFVKELKKLHVKYTVIDLQYSTQGNRVVPTFHCALALVRSKNKGKPKPTAIPSQGRKNG